MPPSGQDGVAKQVSYEGVGVSGSIALGVALSNSSPPASIKVCQQFRLHWAIWKWR
jgi:hypothetical protein